MTKFTKGPWVISDRVSTLIVCGKRSIASSGSYQTNLSDTTEENEANAHLIAAAPDLYEALDALYKNCESKGKYLDMAHEALAKARGE